MTRTLVQIRKQIENLELEAANIRDKEMAGVVGRIREAIDFYGLTADDLFGAQRKGVGRPKGIPGDAVKKTPKKKAALAKYKDPTSDKTWTGHGKRPAWFVQAIEGGKKAEDLAV